MAPLLQRGHHSTKKDEEKIIGSNLTNELKINQINSPCRKWTSRKFMVHLFLIVFMLITIFTLTETRGIPICSP